MNTVDQCVEAGRTTQQKDVQTKIVNTVDQCVQAGRTTQQKEVQTKIVNTVDQYVQAGRTTQQKGVCLNPRLLLVGTQKRACSVPQGFLGLWKLH